MTSIYTSGLKLTSAETLALLYLYQMAELPLTSATVVLAGRAADLSSDVYHAKISVASEPPLYTIGRIFFVLPTGVNDIGAI